MSKTNILITILLILYLFFVTSLLLNTKIGLIDDINVYSYFKNIDFNFLFYIKKIFFNSKTGLHDISPRFIPFQDFKHYILITVLNSPFGLLKIHNIVFKFFTFLFMLKILNFHSKINSLILVSFTLIFWSFPNFPESRVFTQESSQFLFLIMSVYYIIKKPKIFSLNYFLLFITFSLFLFAKETSIFCSSIIIIYLILKNSIRYNVIFIIPYLILFYKVIFISLLGNSYQVSNNFFFIDKLFFNIFPAFRDLFNLNNLNFIYLLIIVILLNYLIKLKIKKINYLSDKSFLFYLLLSSFFYLILIDEYSLRYNYISSFLFILILFLNAKKLVSYQQIIILFLSILFFIQNFYHSIYAYSSQKDIRDIENELINHLSSEKSDIYLNEQTQYQISLCKVIDNNCIFIKNENIPPMNSKFIYVSTFEINNDLGITSKILKKDKSNFLQIYENFLNRFNLIFDINELLSIIPHGNIKITNYVNNYFNYKRFNYIIDKGSPSYNQKWYIYNSNI